MELSRIQAVQRKVAVSAIGPSSVRGQGGSGVATAARDYLARVHLKPFVAGARLEFSRRLNRATDELRVLLPPAARSWGLSRKCLNLFLRDALYNHYLRREFGLATLEPWLEIPLDGVVARELKKLGRRGRLPIWPGVKHLTAGVSEPYQSFAESVASARDIHRVHLDLYLWVEGR